MDSTILSAIHYNVSDHEDARSFCHSAATHYTALYGYAANSSQLRGVCIDEGDRQHLRLAPQYLCDTMSPDAFLAGSNATNETHITLSLYKTFCK